MELKLPRGQEYPYNTSVSLFSFFSMGVPINYMAVLASTVASIVLGFLWYGPLFGKPWMKLMGLTDERLNAAKSKGMTKNYVIMIAGSFLTAYVLAHAIVFGIAYTHIGGAAGGMMGAFYYWLGFVAPVLSGAQLWEGKPWKLFLIQGGYYFVSLLIQGAILGSWV
jgi:hypothetical protein